MGRIALDTARLSARKRRAAGSAGILLAAAVLLVLPGLASAQVTIPNTFSFGGVIDPTQMNANFAALKTSVDPLLVSAFTTFGNLNAGSVTAATTGTVLATPTMTVNKLRPDTKLEIHVNSYFASGTFATATGIFLDVFVDGAVANVAHNSGNIQATNSTLFMTIDAVFSGLAAGPHTVTLVGKTNAGTSTSVTVDPFNAGGAVVVKEVF